MAWEQPPGWEPIPAPQGASAPWQQPEGWEPIAPPGVTSDRLRDGTSPAFSGLTADPPPENWLKKGYREYVAEPLTQAVASAPKYMMGDLDVRDPRAGEIREAPIMSEETARMVVPQTPAGGAAALLSLPFGGTLLRAILAPALAAGGASALSGNPADEVAADAGLHGAAGGIGKGVNALGSWLYRSLPYMKDRIGEANARALGGVLGDIDPAVGQTVAAQEVSPFLKGGKTMAQMRQAATGGDIQKTASASMESAIQKIDAMSGNPSLAGPALNEAYDMIPDVVKNHVVGPIGINGYTLHQAQAIRAYIGGKAFAKAAADRGIDDAALEILRGKMTGEIESALAPAAVPLWRQANVRYGGTSVGDEFLNEGAAKTGLPNRMFLNRNALSDYLDVNRADLIKRMGREQYDTLVNGPLGGAQPGHWDILTPGAGTPMSALMQSLGRGTNTGSIQGLGVPLRTGLPGLGSEWTGREIGTDPNIEALMRYLFQKSAEEYRGAVGGSPIPIGETYGR